MSTSRLALAALLVLSSYSWILAGGQTCSLSAVEFASQVAVVNAFGEDGSTPGVRVTWVIAQPPECVESVTVEFRTSSSGSVVRSYTTTDASQMEVLQSCLRGDTTYYITLIVTGVSTLGTVQSGEIEVLSGDGELSTPTLTVRAERQDGSTPGIKVAWNITAPLDCVESIRVEFRNSSSGSVVRSYNTTESSVTEVIQTGLQCGTTYYVRVVLFGHGVSPVTSNEVQVPIGAPSMQLRFINGSPVVDGNSVRAEIVANLSTASMRCGLLRKEQLESPMVADCSNGSVTFTGVAPGKYRIRVVSSERGCTQSVLRRRVVIPEGHSYCTANLIDEGVIVNGNNMTVHFRGVGPVREFLCVMDRQIGIPCNPPVEYTNMEQGEHHFKVIPRDCGRKYTALPLKFNV